MVMRIIAILVVAVFGAYTCRQAEKAQAGNEESVLVSVSADTLKTSNTNASLDFHSDIKPIFQTRCSPCHFPGGKMYSRLPFDSAKTIVNNSEGILRRIKDPVDNKKIREFIAQSQ